MAALAATLCGFALEAATDHCFTLTMDSGGVVASDVPMLVRVSERLIDGFDYAAAGDGTHFEIVNENGLVLPYEIDIWNPEGESLLWVKVPLFADGKKLTVVYGHTEENMAARAAEVWSNYIGVWHMNGTGGTCTNSAGDARFDGEVSAHSRMGQDGLFGQSVLVNTNAMHYGKEFSEKGGVFIPDAGDLDLGGNFAISSWFYHSTVTNPATDSASFRWDVMFCKRQHPETTHSLNEGSEGGFAVRIKDNREATWNIGVNSMAKSESTVAANAVFTNGNWRHVALVVNGEGRPSMWFDGIAKTNLDVRISDNDERLVIGNSAKAYLDEDGSRAWGGRVDEIRLFRGEPSADYLKAEYAAMTRHHVYGHEHEAYSLTIDQNEFFDDNVEIASDAPPVEPGRYSAGTTITLTARPAPSGMFKRWYGDVARADCESPTISFKIAADVWIYARFVHPWVLSPDKTSMTDGNFKVNITGADESRHTLTVGKNLNGTAAGLLADDDTGSGVIDLGGTIRLPGDGTPWIITKFAAGKSSQVVSTGHVGVVRAYISPGTVTVSNGAQILHCGDDNSTTKPHSTPYQMIILDEPQILGLFTGWFMANQNGVETLIFDVPKVTELKGAHIPYSMSLDNTKFDWWNLPSVAMITNNFFQHSWGTFRDIARRVPIKGTLNLPCVRGVDWIQNEGTQLFLMRNVEAISLGGRDATVTNLCTYAFAGNSSLRKLTLYADPDMQVGVRIFAGHTHNTTNGTETVGDDGIVYNLGTQTDRGRVPDAIHFPGQAISAEAVANLLGDVAAVNIPTKPVVIYASRYQRGWGGDGIREDWLSAPTAEERAAYPGQALIGVYRAGGAAPSGKAVVLHRGNEWDRRPTFSIVLR